MLEHNARRCDHRRHHFRAARAVPECVPVKTLAGASYRLLDGAAEPAVAFAIVTHRGLSRSVSGRSPKPFVMFAAEPTTGRETPDSDAHAGRNADPRPRPTSSVGSARCCLQSADSCSATSSFPPSPYPPQYRSSRSRSPRFRGRSHQVAQRRWPACLGRRRRRRPRDLAGRSALIGGGTSVRPVSQAGPAVVADETTSGRGDQGSVDVDGPEVVDQYFHTQTVIAAKDAVDERGLCRRRGSPSAE